MTRTGFNSQCNTTVIINNYQQVNNVDLNLVKSEPLDSPTSSSSSSSLSNYHLPQQTNAYHHYMPSQQQQLSPQLPPTPPALEQQQPQQFKNQIKMNQLNKAQLPTLPQQQQQPLMSKYRKNKNNLHHNLKPYQHHDHLLGKTPQQTIMKKSNQTPSTARRNERERKRVKNVNQGFQKLRSHIPNTEKKMSKVETLRSAVNYIKQLQDLLNDPMATGSTGAHQHFPAELLFSILNQHNQTNCISNDSEVSSNSSNTNTQELDQQNDQSSLDYFDLAELLS